MKRPLLAIALILSASAGLAQPTPPPGEAEGRARMSFANPSAVIAAEMALARLAREKGQWTALRETAAPDAVMFVPQMTYAQAWLRDRADPPQPARRQTHEVWSSCDGSLMASHGAWQQDKATGWYTTLWQRQPDGTYRWVLDHGDTLAEPLPTPDLIRAGVADCPRRLPDVAQPAPGGKQARKRKESRLPPLDPARRSGKSRDGTLSWDVTTEPDGARNLTVTWRKDGEDQTVTIEQVSAATK